jgi:hypothetical protein
MREGIFPKSRLRRNKTTFISRRTSIEGGKSSTVNILTKNMLEIGQVSNKGADLITNFEHIAENTRESGSIRPYTKASSVVDLESMNNMIQTPVYNMRAVINCSEIDFSPEEVILEVMSSENYQIQMESGKNQS